MTAVARYECNACLGPIDDQDLNSWASSISFAPWDAASGDRIEVWLGAAGPEHHERLDFCNAECLKRWVDATYRRCTGPAPPSLVGRDFAAREGE